MDKRRSGRFRLRAYFHAELTALADDILQLTGGISITSTSESDTNGDAVPDTVVTFDSGDTVTLLGISGITDPDDLLI